MDPNEIDVDDLAEIEAAVDPVTLLRPLRPSDILCDAGQLVGESSCHCSIEDSVIEGRTSPDSITAFCMGEYDACPTWKKNREAEWQGLPSLAAMMKAAKAHRVDERAKKIVKAARLAHAQELLESDTVEGRRFREKLRRILGDGEKRAARLPPERPINPNIIIPD